MKRFCKEFYSRSNGHVVYVVYIEVYSSSNTQSRCFNLAQEILWVVRNQRILHTVLWYLGPSATEVGYLVKDLRVLMDGVSQWLKLKHEYEPDGC